LFIVYAILIFALLIFVHEFGHLITAKAVGVKVNEFAIGMGPRIWSVTRGETRYSIRPFPIGGFCAMEGEDEDSDDLRAFNNRPAPARALVLVAGSGMNVILAILMVSMLIFAEGEPSTRLDAVAADSPAAEAGLRAGDEALAVNGEAVSSWEEIRGALAKTVNDAGLGGSAAEGSSPRPSVSASPPVVELRVRREDGSEHTITASLYEDTDGAYRLGVTPAMTRDAGFFFRSFAYGAQSIWNMAKMIYQVTGDLFTGKAGIDQLTGPVGIVKAVDVTARHGVLYVVELAALISLNLGIVNLLPFPALDGGRIVFLVIRLFTGKRVSDSFEGKFHLVGFALLIGLMIYVTVIDVGRFFVS
jgi:regulator of sigma E protease